MKKFSVIALLCLLPVLLTGCKLDHAEVRASVITLYEENRETFLAAAASGDFSAVGALQGVASVTGHDDHVDIFCQGFGMGSATVYFGLFYSPADDLCAAYGAVPPEELLPEGSGWRYREPGGDNTFYVEPLGDHFFYYSEAY